MTETYTVPARIKKITLGLMLIGLLGVILGFIVYKDHPTRVWANLLVCSYYSIGIALGATFFIATHQIGLGGWHVLIKRPAEAMGAYLPIGGICLLVVLAGAVFADHNLYHWMNPALVDPKSPDFDKIVAGKQGYLNIPFFSFRIICYVVLWSGTAFLIRNISRKEDEVGIQNTYKKSRILSALFIFVFAITESTGSWDLIMSTDLHWYSTLFGWYNFASYTVAGFSAVALAITYLKSQGYLQKVNEDHLHNVALFMFGFSVFWTYLWFAQFMLIWYANMPEETIYFGHRFARPLFKLLFFTNLILNFVVPFLFLMRRSAKRSWKRVCTVAIILLIGHYIDFYMLVMPNSCYDAAGFGWLEISIAAGFVGLFIAVVLNALTKASLTPVNNPYLKESIQTHTIK